MEFDKSKILTVLTVSQAKIGQKGWFGDTPRDLETKFRTKKPYAIKELKEDVLFPFEASYGPTSALFYPAPEPTYAERQAEWVAKNNVKVGTKVRFTKNFTNGEDGSHCCEHRDAKGMEGVVRYTGCYSLTVLVPYFGGLWEVPFTALEVIEEPTYRPFKNAEEFKPYREKWMMFYETIFQHDGYNNDGIFIENKLFTWENAFEKYTFDDGTPFGIKE